ncbi:MAG TPA: hypothetical protein VLF20_06530 [Patescibacteria group bacterium]|nr:hypothetical protein [Patescibacteria group bacterium]
MRKYLQSLFILSLAVLTSVFIPSSAFADQTGTLLPISDGLYTDWTPKSGSTHYTMVDEETCNGTTDFVRTSRVGERDSYGIDLSSIPNGATISQIDITPCASRAGGGTGGTVVLDLFYRLNGVDSADAGGYNPLGATPVLLSTTSFTGLSTVKSSSSSLEIGAVLNANSGKTIRLGQLSTVITYTPLLAPSNLTASESAVGSSSAALLQWTDNASNELGFKIERSTDSANFSLIDTVGVNQTSYYDFPGVGTFYYRVKSYNSGADSTYTNTASVTLP